MSFLWGDDPGGLYLSGDVKKLAEDRSAPHDGKKATWIPNEKTSYARGEIVSTTGDMVKVLCEDNLERDFKKDQLQQMNPPKFYKVEDMANMTYLNEASVLFNLKARYEAMMIYTYSGLFCVAVNPYKRLPIYTETVVNKYRGKRRNEMPPHLFAIADNSYQNMVRDRENQSMLITGESGAGKTENTKKVIAYFASVAKSGSSTDEDPAKKKIGLEEQIVQTNPVLEAYGNAKTIRNNNSSRFGKFIRIHFGPTGKIAGADIETYLLEKSRVTYQQPGIERNYHVYYFLTSPWSAAGKVTDMCLLNPDPGKYFYINQGCLTVDNWDDDEEAKLMDDAFVDLGFKKDEYHAMYRCTAAILQFGEMKFKQRPREEQAEADGTGESEKVAFLVGVNSVDLLKCLLHPKVKVGSEMVVKNQSKQQVEYAVAALAKCLYDRMFKWLVMRVNQTLDTVNKRQYFIGVLDIAGFEIFEYNTFEQLCINYTNERLQQFFNHHMFVLEQEEYKKEGIVWEFINFGMDLQACIDLIEKPLGILSILEEECMFPKASDDTFKAKLFENHGKNPSFSKPRPSKKKLTFEPHFELHHYAGTVGYNICGWLDKNKDPINQTVVDLLAASKEPLVAYFFSPPPEEGAGAKKSKKKGGSQTLSATHKEQLHKLMATLYSTHPSFVRCLIPNEQKQSGLVESHLVLHQLQCNGVLEGIRICRKGFPNRMIYSEFKQRYSILAGDALPSETFVEAKEATGKILETIKFEQDDPYRLGNTKVFFKAGMLGMLEDLRDIRLGKILSYFQAHMRGYLMRRTYGHLCDQRTAATLIQNNIRKWIGMRSWQWWKLYTRIKPLLTMMRAEEELAAREAEFDKCRENIVKMESQFKELEDQNANLVTNKNELYQKMQDYLEINGESEEKIQDLITSKQEMQENIKELEESIRDAEMMSGSLEDVKKRLDEKCVKLKDDMRDMENNLKKAEDDKLAKENKIKNINEDMARNDETMTKLNKDKKSNEETLSKVKDDLASEEEKVSQLSKLKTKLEDQIDSLEGNLERERKNRGDADKIKRKTESELKQTQETIDDLERAKSGLEDNLRKKENELKIANSKADENANIIASLEKKIKELQRRIEELEEELEAERAARSKAEKQRNELNRELSELGDRLDEASGATASQLEQNRKRESELQKMKRDLEQQIVSSEAQSTTLRKKCQDTVNELSDQVDQITKVKSRMEKEKNQLKGEVSDFQTQVDSLAKTKAVAERNAKSLETQLNDLCAKVDENKRIINDLSSSKSLLEGEAGDLSRQVEEAENAANHLNRIKQQLVKELDESRTALEEETQMRSRYQSDAKSAVGDLEAAREALEEEREAKSDLQRLVQKANSEAALWKQKLTSGEGGVRPEDVEALKKKLTSRIAETEAALEAANSKMSNLEKQKARLNGELEDMSVEVERASALAAAADKRQKQFDKSVAEWKAKADGLSQDLNGVHADSRANAAQVYQLKAQMDETHENVEALRRENQNLADEIKDLTMQLSDGGRSSSDLEKICRRLLAEKDELQSALEEAESALENEEMKVQRAQLEMSAVRQEIDRRLAEKDEEFESTRKNHQRALDSLQGTVESEARGKSEALRMKKKLESDINELECALEATNIGRAEAEKATKKYQSQVMEGQKVVEEQQRARDEAREQSSMAERRANAMAGEIEELRTQLEMAERARKAAEAELHETGDRVSELSSTNAGLTASRRQLEATAQTMQVDLEDQQQELRTCEDSANRAMTDASRISEELRKEQEHSSHIEKMRRTLEMQVKELQSRLDEAEASALKGGKRMIQKLEQRVRELEVDIDNESRRHAETTKSIRKQEKRVKDLAYQADEDRKNNERMQDMANKLQDKIKLFKRQVEEAEEVAGVNLNKYRKVQHELEDAEERADMAETTLSKLRAKNRSSMSAAR